MTTSTLKHLCQQFVERSKTLEYKGKRRDDAVMDFFVGALSAMSPDHPDYEHVAAVTAMIFSVRGYSEVERIAKREEN